MIKKRVIPPSVADGNNQFVASYKVEHRPLPGGHGSDHCGQCPIASVVAQNVSMERFAAADISYTVLIAVSRWRKVQAVFSTS